MEKLKQALIHLDVMKATRKEPLTVTSSFANYMSMDRCDPLRDLAPFGAIHLVSTQNFPKN